MSLPVADGQSATTPELQRLLDQYWLASYGPGEAGHDAIRGKLEALSARRAEEALAQVQRYVPFPLTARRVLEVGAGVGTTVLTARRHGIGAYGVEPSLWGARAGRQQFRDADSPEAPVVCASGEALPFPSDYFDAVCSFQVLEHTRDPDRVLAETVRVLRPGGYFVHIFPNYGSFWEGHYGVPWIPYLSKSLGRLYLRLLGRSTKIFDDLQLVSYRQVRRLLRAHPDVQVVSWGADLWEYRVRTLDFTEWAYLGRVKQAVRWLHRLRLIGLGLRIGRACHFETPIVLVGVKRAGQLPRAALSR